jgi:hypothetical protein
MSAPAATQKPHPPDEDNHELEQNPRKEAPYTYARARAVIRARAKAPRSGWDAEIPSAKGGDGEKDFMNKPPYHWSLPSRSPLATQH